MSRWQVRITFTQTVEADTQEDAEEMVGEYVEGASVGYGPEGMDVAVESMKVQ